MPLGYVKSSVELALNIPHKPVHTYVILVSACRLHSVYNVSLDLNDLDLTFSAVPIISRRYDVDVELSQCHLNLDNGSMWKNDLK